MRKFQIVTDSSCDLPQYKVDELGLKVAQLDVLVEGRPTKEDCDVDPKEFYKGLREGLMASTSAANIDKLTKLGYNSIDRTACERSVMPSHTQE